MDFVRYVLLVLCIGVLGVGPAFAIGGSSQNPQMDPARTSSSSSAFRLTVSPSIGGMSRVIRTSDARGNPTGPNPRRPSFPGKVHDSYASIASVPTTKTIAYWDANDSNCPPCAGSDIETVKQNVLDNFHRRYGPLNYTIEWDGWNYSGLGGYHFTWWNQNGNWNGNFVVFPVCTDGSTGANCLTPPIGNPLKKSRRWCRLRWR